MGSQVVEWLREVPGRDLIKIRIELHLDKYLVHYLDQIMDLESIRAGYKIKTMHSLRRILKLDYGRIQDLGSIY